MRREIGSLLSHASTRPYGLSENWLLRHLGDLHWQIICDALGKASRDIQDEQGSRLYASFVRVDVDCLARYRALGKAFMSGWIEWFDMAMACLQQYEFAGRRSEHIGANGIAVSRREKDGSNTPANARFAAASAGMYDSRSGK